MLPPLPYPGPCPPVAIGLYSPILTTLYIYVGAMNTNGIYFFLPPFDRHTVRTNVIDETKSLLRGESVYTFRSIYKYILS